MKCRHEMPPRNARVEDPGLNSITANNSNHQSGRNNINQQLQVTSMAMVIQLHSPWNQRVSLSRCVSQSSSVCQRQSVSQRVDFIDDAVSCVPRDVSWFPSDNAVMSYVIHLPGIR